MSPSLLPNNDGASGAEESPTDVRGVAGGCPVKRDNSREESSSTTPPSSSGWRSWLPSVGRYGGSIGNGAQPATSIGLTEKSEAGGCPVKHEDRTTSSTASSPFGARLPASIEEAARHPQSPQPGQRVALSTRRAVSSIPRADELRPSEDQGSGDGGAGCERRAAPHQPDDAGNWVYPSEQQFYNAMRRKGWNAPADAIPTVLQIHNAVNERGWSEVVRWERTLHGNDTPRLVRFLGRPNDTSPKAWLNHNILWYNRPFDRHDWYVDRGDDQEPRRYVIDFYNGNDGEGVRGSAARPPAMYLDVRPALDEPGAFVDRAKMLVRDAFPGIFAAFDGYRGTNPSVGEEATPPLSRSSSENSPARAN